MEGIEAKAVLNKTAGRKGRSHRQREKEEEKVERREILGQKKSRAQGSKRGRTHALIGGKSSSDLKVENRARKQQGGGKNQRFLSIIAGGGKRGRGCCFTSLKQKK